MTLVESMSAGQARPSEPKILTNEDCATTGAALPLQTIKSHAMKQRPATIVFLALTALTARAEDTQNTDTAQVVNIEDAVVVTAPKENTRLRQTAGAVSLFSQHEVEQTHSRSLKELSGYVPNFFMPDYGSSLTSAVYIRGIGSRINTPAVGLYVDHVAYNEKSAYDIRLLDVERIDVLRGPQGTLYGRNTMGGLIRVFTRNPFRQPGTDIRMGFSSRDREYTFSASHHHRLNRHTAFSLGGFYQGRRGWYKNVVRNEYADGKEAGGGRARVIWLPNEDWRIDAAADYSYTDEGGYAYRYLGAVNPDEEEHREWIGKIGANRRNFYRRGVLNSSLNVGYTGQQVELTSITAFQNLNDNMTLDQDFLPEDLFGLTQKQRSNTWSEELTVKSRGTQRRWQWVTGMFAMNQQLHTQSPVSLTETFLRAALGQSNTYLNRMGMGLDMHLRQDPFVSDGRFETPVTNLALFHQSTLRRLFGAEGLELTAGLRVEHERLKLEHNYGGVMHYDIEMQTPGGAMPQTDLTDEALFRGQLTHHSTQLLPKVALHYHLDRRNNVYVTWSKGYRSGGYNIQMFGDLVQGVLRACMMDRVRPGVEALLNSPTMAQMPASVKAMILSRLTPETGDADDTYYKPEYSYNYEAGGHFTLWDGKMEADVAAFYMDVYDQQISKFVNSGLGRAMTNAGRGQSCGAEISVKGALLDNRLCGFFSYGFTHATFKKYDTGWSGSTASSTNYKGNRVPFVPAHQLAAGATYVLTLPQNAPMRRLRFGLSCTANGDVYWDEANTLRQPFYALLNANMVLDFGAVEVDVWGKNLTQTHYDAFTFTSGASMRELKFAQQGRPLQIGITLHARL